MFFLEKRTAKNLEKEISKSKLKKKLQKVI